MRIVVISDTHISTSTDKLPRQIIEELKNSDLCIHAGDFIDIEVSKEISKIVELKAVRGNMDTREVRNTYPDKQIITVEGLKIGLIHGGGSPFNILPKVENSFQESLDIYIFGHTHSAYNKIHEGKLFFNPGSPTDKFFAKFNSYGILNIKGNRFERRVIRVE